MTIELPIEELRSVFNRGRDTGLAIVSPEGQWLKVNDYLCQMLGYDEEELLGMTFQQITHPDDLLAEQLYLQRLTAGAIDHYMLKKRYMHKGGQIVWGELNRSAKRDESGQPLFFISHIRDITAEKAAERRPSMFKAVASRVRQLFH